MDSKKTWINQTNIYEVNLRQYTPEGTIASFQYHLPRLRDMGVETLWFMPITPISQKNKKGSLGSYYACSDYCSVNPEFGTLEDFKAIISEAHRLGMKVIMDWVANHTGWDHTWTLQHPEWYEKDENTADFKRASGMDDIIELDFRNTQMRMAMIDAMMFWVKECDIDGFRCDLAFWVELDFWLQAIPLMNQIKPLFWLAESDPLDFPDLMQVFDAAYSWKWMHQTEAFSQNKCALEELIALLEQYQHAPGRVTWFTSNHDENSWNGSEYEKYGEAALLLAVFSCTWLGIPLVYSGQELPNHKRLAFFEKDVIDWTGTYALHDFYKTLLQLHSSQPALSADSDLFRIHTSSDRQILGYVRKRAHHMVVVLLNFSNRQVRFDLQAEWIKGIFNEIFTDTRRDFTRQKGFEIEPWSYLVFVNS